MIKTRIVSTWKMNSRTLTYTLDYDGMLSPDSIDGVLHDFKVDARCLSRELDYQLIPVEQHHHTYEENNLR